MEKDDKTKLLLLMADQISNQMWKRWRIAVELCIPCSRDWPTSWRPCSEHEEWRSEIEYVDLLIDKIEREDVKE